MLCFFNSRCFHLQVISFLESYTFVTILNVYSIQRINLLLNMADTITANTKINNLKHTPQRAEEIEIAKR